jgi:type VI secretion system protein ImpL
MSKEDLNKNASGAVLLFLGLTLAALFAGLWLWVVNEGPRRGWVADNHNFVGAMLIAAWFACMFLATLYERGIRQWAADSRVARIFNRQRLEKRTASESAGTQRLPATDATNLRNILRDRHGWRWRYRERWVLVAGDGPLVKRLAPGLAENGYAVTSGAVLLYAKQTTSALDIAWLAQIRRMRRRRPVDAVVWVTRNRGAPATPFDTDNIAQRLGRHARALRWAAPVYVLNATDFGSESSDGDEAIGFTWSNARVHEQDIEASLRDLTSNLADTGVARLTRSRLDRYPAELSQHIAGLREALPGLVLQIAQSRFWRHPVHGLLFAPLFRERELVARQPGDAADGEAPAQAQRTIWNTVAEHSRRVHGRRVGFSLSSAAAWVAIAAMALSMTGTMVSGFTNRATIRAAQDTLTKLAARQDRTQAVVSLDSLDRQIDTLEIRQRDGAPWITRFGLNRDSALLGALWPGYANAASRILVAPIRQQLEQRLRQLASLSDAQIASGGNTQVQAAYDTLKTYLMLAQPDRAVAAFLTPQLVATAEPVRPENSLLSRGSWEDLRQHTIAFFAKHLGRDSASDASGLAIVPDGSLIASTRQTVISVRGLQNSTDAVYQQILDEAKAKYLPVSLATLLGDTTSRGLFSTTATVPGVFTRAAWDERISKAIDDASEQQNVAGDWVLSDAKAAQATPSTLKAELRRRYFDDYGRAWAVFLNSLRWQPAATLSATADQLTLLGDPQRSPLVSLMNAIVWQAGAGANTQSLADNLISKAQRLVGGDEQDPSKQTQSQAAPLAAAFGPILRLTGSDLMSDTSAKGRTAPALATTGDLSLARYLERVIAMRLKLEQIAQSADADAMSRTAAQAVLQGRTSDIAESRDYASRLAASLGEQWAGFGQLFQAPLDQTWQAVVQPAASSLNDIWRLGVVADWNRTFGGRYPFADSDNDASLPEMARFMRPDNGAITQFVTTQLAGVVERQGDRWVAAQGTNSGALALDPAFLEGLNRLTRVSTVLFPSGDAHVRFELRAVPTPGVTDMKFVLSGRELHYFNQKEEWMPFEWPGQSLENLSHIEWQTEQGGLRSALDSQGRFGLIRLLERAQVSQQDNARYLVSWTPDTSQGIALRVQLRSEAGAGPLDVLQLRRFTLPSRIFITGNANARPKLSDVDPPPLPPSVIRAAKHAAIPLPQGTLRQVE